jgi:hypothetical protein
VVAEQGHWSWAACPSNTNCNPPWLQTKKPYTLKAGTLRRGALMAWPCRHAAELVPWDDSPETSPDDRPGLSRNALRHRHPSAVQEAFAVVAFLHCRRGTKPKGVVLRAPGPRDAAAAPLRSKARSPPTTTRCWGRPWAPSQPPVHPARRRRRRCCCWCRSQRRLHEETPPRVASWATAQRRQRPAAARRAAPSRPRRRAARAPPRAARTARSAAAATWATAAATGRCHRTRCRLWRWPHAAAMATRAATCRAAAAAARPETAGQRCRPAPLCSMARPRPRDQQERRLGLPQHACVAKAASSWFEEAQHKQAGVHAHRPLPKEAVRAVRPGVFQSGGSGGRACAGAERVKGLSRRHAQRVRRDRGGEVAAGMRARSLGDRGRRAGAGPRGCGRRCGWEGTRKRSSCSGHRCCQRGIGGRLLRGLWAASDAAGGTDGLQPAGLRRCVPV